MPEILGIYVSVLAELRARDAVRSGKVVGDYAEALVARALRLDRAVGSAVGYDAVDPGSQERYQIKARRLSPRWRDVGMGPFRNLESGLFQVFVGVVFDEGFEVVRALRVPYDVVRHKAREVGYDRTLRLQVGPELAATPGVTDITEIVRDAAALWAFEALTRP